MYCDLFCFALLSPLPKESQSCPCPNKEEQFSCTFLHKMGNHIWTVSGCPGILFAWCVAQDKVCHLPFILAPAAFSATSSPFKDSTVAGSYDLVFHDSSNDIFGILHNVPTYLLCITKVLILTVSQLNLNWTNNLIALIHPRMLNSVRFKLGKCKFQSRGGENWYRNGKRRERFCFGENYYEIYHLICT